MKAHSVIYLRVPPELKDRLERKAEQSKRSVTTVIIETLEASLAADAFERLHNLLPLSGATIKKEPRK